MRSLLVLGLGNPILRDDAAGIVACDEARKRLSPVLKDRPVTFKPLCAGGFDLIYEVEGYDGLIVVDAFHAPGGTPGRVRTLSFEDLMEQSTAAAPGHLLSLPRAVEFSRRLGYRTPRLLAAIVIEVDAEALEFGEDLSPDVENAIPVAVDTVCRLVNEVLSETSSFPGSEDVWEKKE